MEKLQIVRVKTYVPRCYKPKTGELISLTPSTFNIVPWYSDDFPLAEQPL